LFLEKNSVNNKLKKKDRFHVITNNKIKIEYHGNLELLVEETVYERYMENWKYKN
jgi:hypothetical protein